MFAKKWYRKSNTVIFFFFESAHSLQVLKNTFSESSAEEEQRFRNMGEKKNFEKNYTRSKKKIITGNRCFQTIVKSCDVFGYKRARHYI